MNWQPSISRQIVWLLLYVAVCFVAAGLGGLATASSMADWYPTLEKPAWTPPAWVFGPVWSALYLMMAVAAWLVWRRDGWPAASTPLVWFAIQLAFNVGWSVIFFGLRSPGFALIEIIFLWLAIAITTKLFWSRSRVAAALMAPYLAWSTFAVFLNLAIYRLNA